MTGHLNLRIEPGKTWGLLGSNRVGKTTTITLYFAFGFRQ
jgi:ABC-type multidrug transport system ATPase subunit